MRAVQEKQPSAADILVRFAASPNADIDHAKEKCHLWQTREGRSIQTVHGGRT